MRRFFLQNGSGGRYSFGADTRVYAANPTGLGTDAASSFTDLGHGFFATANEIAEPQTPVCFDIVAVGGSAYAQYTALLAWIAAAGDDLYLGYAPESVEYLRRVKLTGLSKTELQGGRWLTCPATFMPLTPWYRPVAAAQQAQTPDGAFLFDTADRVLGVAHLIGSEAEGQSVTISTAGHLSPAVVLRYKGALTAPVIRVMGAASGTEYGRCVIDTQTGEADTLVWSTEYDRARVEVVDANGTAESLLDDVDLAYDPFPRPATTEPLLITLTSDDEMMGTAEVTAYYYYRSV